MATRFTTRSQGWSDPHLPHAKNLARRMTVHLSIALIAYSLLQFWLVASAIDTGAPAALAYVAVAVTLFGVVPAVSRIEIQWKRLTEDALPSNGLCRNFRRQAVRVWIAALFVPVIWVGAFVGAARAAPAIF